MAVVLILEVDLDIVGQQELTLGFSREIIGIFKEILPMVFANLKVQIPNLVKIAIINSPEYEAMQPGGVLYGQIGRTDISRILSDIIEEIIKEIEIIEIPLTTVGENIFGGFEINILELSFSRVLRVTGGSFVSEGKGASLVDWLRWLLFEGDRKMVLGFKYLEDRGTSRFSRTETGIMRKSKSGSWGFEPREMSGTANNNWLTRAMDNISDELLLLIEKEFRRASR